MLSLGGSREQQDVSVLTDTSLIIIHHWKVKIWAQIQVCTLSHPMEPHDLLKLLRVHHQMWRVSSNLIYFYFSKEAQFNTVECQMLIYYTKYMKGSIKMSRIITHNLYENQETWVGNTTSVTTGMSEGISKRLNKSWTWSARFFRSCYSHPALAAKSQTCIK